MNQTTKFILIDIAATLAVMFIVAHLPATIRKQFGS